MAFTGTPNNQQYGGLTPRAVIAMGDNAGTPTPLAVNSSGQQTVVGAGSGGSFPVNDNNSSLTVDLAPASALTTGQFTVTTSSGTTIAIAADPTARTLVIKNTHATLPIYIGPTGVETNTGHYIGPGEPFAIGGPGAGLAYYAIMGSSTATGTWARTK